MGVKEGEGGIDGAVSTASGKSAWLAIPFLHLAYKPYF